MKPEQFGYRKNDNRKLVIAMAFLVVSAAFFSFQIMSLLSQGDGGDGTGGTQAVLPGQGQPSGSGQEGVSVGSKIVSAKRSLEGIGEEIDSILKLL